MLSGLDYELVSVEEDPTTKHVTTTIARAYVVRIWAGYDYPQGK